MVEKTEVFGVAVDIVDMPAAVSRIMALADERKTGPSSPALVVTPNLDHAVRLRHDTEFRATYAAADVVLADGLPLVLASRLGGGPRLPERVAGSDLVVPLCIAAARRRRSVFIIGTSLDVLSIACRGLVSTAPGLEIAGVYSPGMGFDATHPETEEALTMINAARPDLLFVALGSPRQELWATALRHRLDAGAIVCVGAAFDFLAGRPARAPRLLQRLCLEWLWRLAHDPARFAERYGRNLAYLPLLVLGQLRQPAARRAEAVAE